MHRVSRTAVRATVGALTDKPRAAEAFFNRSTSGSHDGKAWIDLGDPCSKWVSDYN